MKIYEYKLKCGEELKETIEYCRDVPSLVAVLMVLSQAIKELCPRHCPHGGTTRTYGCCQSLLGEGGGSAREDGSAPVGWRFL